MRRRQLAPLSPVDEALLLWQEAGPPWNVQVGIRAGSIDADRLRASFNAGLRLHPLTSCAVERNERGGLAWVQNNAPDVGPIAVLDCSKPSALDALRVEQFERPFSMREAPLMRAVIAQTGDAAYLVTTLSHVMTDGLGALRFLRSVGRAYRDEDDPEPAVDPAMAQRALTGPRPTSVGELTRRWTGRVQSAVDQIAPRARLVGSDASTASGFGVIVASTPVDAVTTARRNHGVAFDEYAMAVLHVTIAAWNDERGVATGRVAVSQAVNLRPDGWWNDVVLNLASFVSVTSDSSDRATLQSTLNRIVPQLDPADRVERARAALVAARAARVLPSAARVSMIAGLGSERFDTCAISNLGHQADPPHLGEHGTLEWMVTSAMPTDGLTLMPMVVGHDLIIGVSYRRDHFDEATASAFVDAYLSNLRAG